jgi:hypothetical protein
MVPERVRRGYRENLTAWNALFPPIPEKRSWEDEMLPEEFDPEGLILYPGKSRENAKRVVQKLKERADKSGDPQVWHRGDPLDGLNPGLKERILKALEFQI